MIDFGFSPIDPKYLPDSKLWADDVAERSAQAVYKRLSEELPLIPEDLGTATNDYDVVVDDVWPPYEPGEIVVSSTPHSWGDMLTDCDPGDEDDAAQ